VLLELTLHGATEMATEMESVDRENADKVYNMETIL